MSCKLQYQVQVTSTSRPRAEAIYMEHSLRGLKDCVRVGIDIGEVEVSTREGQSKKVVTGRILDLKVWSSELSMITALTLKNLIILWLDTWLGSTPRSAGSDSTRTEVQEQRAGNNGVLKCRKVETLAFVKKYRRSGAGWCQRLGGAKLKWS
ncbi:hypothetical protein B0H13DRAFT_1888692 [Mycena leptocephala]|nr:hypothetical protein B0H13DRAFT_1888692 [Mycena leptocephala]